MTKKEIVKTICDRANKQKPPLLKGNLTQLATKEIVQWTFEAIINTLVKEGRIELRNFGVFEVKQRKPRKARNPRTGASVSVESEERRDVSSRVRKWKNRSKKFAKLADAKKKPRKGKSKHAEPSTNGSASVPAAAASAPVTCDAPAAT